MSRILWLSNPPWVGSGYGEQTALFLPRLQKLGHELGIVCNFGFAGATTQWQGIPAYPSDNEWGNKTIGSYAKDFQADTVVALCDAFVLNPEAWPDDLHMGLWAPIDHYPLPPSVLATLMHEKVTPIAMSRFGVEQMQAFNLDPVYVPHGVDTRLFKPRPELKAAARDSLGIPEDVFLVGMVAANKGSAQMPRKGFPEAFQAFARFAKTHPDAWMYVHTEAGRGAGGGLDLDMLATACDIPKGRLRFPPDEAWHLPVSNTVVANLYQAFDVLLAPSYGEGFGIPILEAQACGVPVITSNHSAMSEVGGVGWLVDGQPHWDELQKSWFYMPFVASIQQALAEAHELARDETLRAAAVEHAQAYDADAVTERYWLPALERLGCGIEESRQVRRAKARKKVAA